MKLAWIALAWIAFAFVHSALASLGAKERVTRRWPAAARWYRLAFNGLSLAAVLPIVWLSYALDGPMLWQWTGAWRWLSNGLALAAIAGFIATARWYDMDTFLGLRQIREHDRRPDGNEGLSLSPFHHYVRHPWYAFGLVLVWTGDKTLPLLVSALAISAYLVIGSKLEEKKLIARYGDDYRRYMEKVPGLIPLPWKHL